jgi:hypothetical protein
VAPSSRWAEHDREPELELETAGKFWPAFGGNETFCWEQEEDR